MSFEIKGHAAGGRLGRLSTPHGVVTTPTLLPVVNPNLPLVSPAEMKRLFGAEMVITNSYIIRKNDALRDRALKEGVHKTIGWEGPVMTDSGTFQSYVYGSVDVKPLEIVEFQRQIGVDVGTILDVFTTPDRTREEAAADLKETLARAREAVGAKNGMLLAATVQGGRFVELRAEAARALGAMDVDLVPIGGVVPLMESARYADLAQVILAAKRNLPAGKPVHLFGAGHPLVFPLAVALGCDLFDSASYAKYAKDGRLIFPYGTRRLDELEELPCACPECDRWRSVAELKRAVPHEREAALARHNLHVSFAEMRRIRQALHEGTLWELVEERAVQNPALLDALRVLQEPEAVNWLETLEPVSADRAFLYRGPHTMHRPAVLRLQERLLKRYRPPGRVCYLLPDRTKPYAEGYASYLDAFRAENATYLVDSPLGPVPLELDLLHPIAQSVFPQTLDEEALAVCDRFAQAFLRRFDGCEIYPFDARSSSVRAEGASLEAWDWLDRRRVRATADHQFGPGAADALFPEEPSFVRSPNNEKLRNCIVGGDMVASFRPTDGRLSLRLEGGEALRRAFASPRHRLVLEAEAAQFVAEGKNAMARFVSAADPELRSGDECLLVTPQDKLVGVGRMVLSGGEVGQVGRGVAARTRKTVEEE